MPQKKKVSHSTIILYSSLPLGIIVLLPTYKKSGNPSDYLIFYVLYSSKIKFKPCQRRLAVLKYSLRLVS